MARQQLQVSPISDLRSEVLRPKPVRVPAWIWDAKDIWLDDGDMSERSRLSEHALRVALIQSSCNGDVEITQESFEAALRYAEWQERLRRVYRPGIGESNDAICFEAVDKALREAHEKQVTTQIPHPRARLVTSDLEEQCKMLHFTSIMNAKSYYRRFGPTLLNRTRANMVHEHILSEVVEEEEDPNDSGQSKKAKKGKKTPFVKLARRIR